MELEGRGMSVEEMTRPELEGWFERGISPADAAVRAEGMRREA